MTFPRSLPSLFVATALLSGCGTKPSGDASASGAGSSTASEGGTPTSEKETAMSGDALTQIRQFIQEKGIDFSKGSSRMSLPKPPKLSFDENTRYFWNLETNKGSMVIELWPQVAPMHVSSTMFLVESGFYDGLRFHRIIDGFMAQGGCPLGTGTGSPGYQYAGEFKAGVVHDRKGLLSMANAGANTDGSQFFLTFVPTPHLDGKHTLFGEVVEGKGVLSELEACGTRGGTPTTVVTMTKSTITTKPK